MTSRRRLVDDTPRGPGQVAAVRIVEVLGAFAFAADIGAGQPLGHALRTVRLSMELADRLSLDDAERVRVFQTGFLAHAGCTAGTGDFVGLTANEMAAYGELFALDPTNHGEVLDWLMRHRSPGSSDEDVQGLLDGGRPSDGRAHTRGVRGGIPRRGATGPVGWYGRRREARLRVLGWQRAVRASWRGDPHRLASGAGRTGDGQHSVPAGVGGRPGGCPGPPRRDARFRRSSTLSEVCPPRRGTPHPVRRGRARTSSGNRCWPWTRLLETRP